MNVDRCGIFGRLLVDGASCLPNSNKATCLDAVGARSRVNCSWDELRGVCDASREDLLFVLRRDYRDELARVSLRRERCSAREGTLASCSGDCQLVNGTCTLRTLDALLAVTGEDCPISTLMRQNANCWSLAGEASCTARARSDGLKDCDWRRDQCEAHPIALEFDLLLVLGLGQPEISTPMRAAQARCLQATSENCNSLCAPAVVAESAAVQRKPWRALALLLAAAVLRRRE